MRRGDRSADGRPLGPQRNSFVSREMTFRQAHSLAAHRPLGSVMPARLRVYRALTAVRHRENGVAAGIPPASTASRREERRDGAPLGSDTQKDDDMSLQGMKIAILIAPRGT